MITARIKLPATLTVTLLGLAASSCGSPDTMHDAAADAAQTCAEACTAQFSSVNPDCAPQPGGAACVAVGDGGGAGECSFATLATANGATCCCYPIV